MGEMELISYLKKPIQYRVGHRWRLNHQASARKRPDKSPLSRRRNLFADVSDTSDNDKAG